MALTVLERHIHSSAYWGQHSAMQRHQPWHRQLQQQSWASAAVPEQVADSSAEDLIITDSAAEVSTQLCARSVKASHSQCTTHLNCE